MKKYVIAVLVTVLCLAGCGKSEVDTPSGSKPSNVSTPSVEVTPVPAMEPTTKPTQAPTPESTLEPTITPTTRAVEDLPELLQGNKYELRGKLSVGEHVMGISLQHNGDVTWINIKCNNGFTTDIYHNGINMYVNTDDGWCSWSIDSGTNFILDAFDYNVTDVKFSEESGDNIKVVWSNTELNYSTSSNIAYVKSDYVDGIITPLQNTYLLVSAEVSQNAKVLSEVDGIALLEEYLEKTDITVK